MVKGFENRQHSPVERPQAKAEGPATSGVHHELRPQPIFRSPENIMQQRALDAKKIAEFQQGKAEAAARGEEFDAETYYAEKDREAAATRRPTHIGIPRMNPRAVAAAVAAAAETTVEAGNTLEAAQEDPTRFVSEKEATVVPVEKTRAEMLAEMGEKTVAEMNPAERTLHAEVMREHALARQKEIRQRAAAVANAEEVRRLRNSLRAVPDAVESRGPIEKQKMPGVDANLVITIPGFGDAMILRVDEDSQSLLFTTPDERRKVDAQLSMDEGQDSRTAADFMRGGAQNVIALTPDQARQYIAAANAKRMFSAGEGTAQARETVGNSSRHPQSRYKIAA